MKTFYSIAFTLLVAAACTSTFAITKDGKTYFFGSKSEAFQKMLCDSGDLKKILDEARLPDNVSSALHRYNCSAEQSKENVGAVYASMLPEQRRELRLSFQKNGYDINELAC